MKKILSFLAVFVVCAFISTPALAQVAYALSPLKVMNISKCAELGGDYKNDSQCDLYLDANDLKSKVVFRMAIMWGMPALVTALSADDDPLTLIYGQAPEYTMEHALYLQNVYNEIASCSALVHMGIMKRLDIHIIQKGAKDTDLVGLIIACQP